MANTKRNSTIVGYNFILFQSAGNNLVKCWFDGNENYDYLYIDDFISLFEKVGTDYEKMLYLQRYLDTTSFYLWDVDNNSVQVAKLDKTPDRSIGDDLNEVYSNALKALSQKDEELYRIV